MGSYLDCHGVMTPSLGPPISTNLLRRTMPILNDVELELFFSLLINGKNSLYFMYSSCLCGSFQ